MLAPAYLGLLFFIIFIEITRKKVNQFDFLTLFNIFFSLLYSLPAFILNAKYYTNTIQTPLAIFLGYFLVLIGFYSTSAIRMGENILITSKKSDNFIIGFAFFLLLFSCLSIHIYSTQYGGFLSALSNANLIRTGAVERGVFSFFKRFLYFSFFASYLLCSFIFIKRIKIGRLLLYTAFLLSVIISIIASIIVAARATIIMGFSTFYLVYVLQTKRVNLIFTIPVICLTAIFILYGKEFFFSLSALPDGYDAVRETFVESIDSQQKSEFSFEKLVEYFTYPVYSLDTAFDTLYQLRLLGDWLYGFASLLPDRLLNVEIPETVSYYNTQYLIGTNEYTIPAGFLASCIYSMWWPGLFIFCFTYGWIGRYLQTILQNHFHSISWIPFLYVLTALAWADFLGSGDPRIFLQAHFWSLMSSFILFSIAIKISVVRHRKS